MYGKIFTALFCLCPLLMFADVRYRNIPEESLMAMQISQETIVVLEKNWKVFAGDNMAFAAADFDDSKWQAVAINKPLQLKPHRPLVWYRNAFELADTPTGGIQLDMGYISAGDQVYINGVLCGEFGFRQMVNGSSNRYRRYLIADNKNPLKKGRNVIAVRVKNGFKRGMYRGIPQILRVPEKVVCGDLSTRSRGKTAVFRQVTEVPEVNRFFVGERFFIRPQLALFGSAGQLPGELEITVRKSGKITQQIKLNTVLQKNKFIVIDTQEIKPAGIGKYDVECSFRADGRVFWQRKAEFSVEPARTYQLKVDKTLQNLLTRKLPLQIGENSFGTTGLRDINEKNELFDNYKTPDARATLGNVLGINKKYPGAVLLHSNVKYLSGFKYRDFIDQIGGNYDGLINGWPAGWIRPEQHKKSTAIATEFSGWTSKRIRFSYPENTWLDVSYSQLSPAVRIKSNASAVRFFENSWSVGSIGMIFGEKSGKFTGLGKKITEFETNYLVCSFRGSRRWDEFDVPYLMVFEKRPASVILQKNGVTVNFRGNGGTVQLMPLYGVTLQSPVKLADNIMQRSRFWSKALLAMPEKVIRTAQVDYQRDTLTVCDKFVRQIIRDDWNTEPLKLAPVPPSLMLAAASGLDITISHPVKDLDYAGMNGPFCAAENIDSYVFELHNAAHLVTEVRKVENLSNDPAMRKIQQELEKIVRTKIMPEISVHPFQRLTANKSGKANSSGTMEPDFTNLMMSMKFLSDDLKRDILKEIDAEKANFFDNELMAKARKGKKYAMVKVNRPVYNPLTKKQMNALNRHAHDNGIDCACYEALRMYLAWSLGYYCDQWEFIKSKLPELEKSFNLVVNSHDWSYSLCWDSYSGIRIGNGLQESTIFHAGFAGFARVMDKLGNKEMRDLAAYYSIIHLIGMTGSVGKATGEYVRCKRPYLAAHSLSADIDFLEKTSHDRYCEINERGGLFSWVITPRNMFSGSMIMTHLPEILRPYKEYWSEFSDRHFSGKLNGRMYSREVPARVDIFCYAVANPPFPVKELFELRKSVRRSSWQQMADYRALLEYNSKVSYEKQW